MLKKTLDELLQSAKSCSEQMSKELFNPGWQRYDLRSVPPRRAILTSICKRCAFFACSLAFIFIFNLSTCDLDLIHVEAISPIKVTVIYTVILRADVRITALPLNIPKLTRDY